MSTQLIDEEIQTGSSLSNNQVMVSAEDDPRDSGSNPNAFAELVAKYASTANLPVSHWLLILELENPRGDVRSLSERTRLVKRVMDIVISATMLVLLAPVMLLVILLVKLTSPGPAIYSQVRVGLNLRRDRGDRRARTNPESDNDKRRAEERDRRRSEGFGKPFVLYKFRTMRTDAEKNGAQLAVKGDSRITPIGRFLRKTRLDELPQLWNVLKGEMTLVGPRPERPVFIEQLSQEIPDYINRLGLKPGLTGLAQVINGYDTDIESIRRKVALDLLYLQNCCIKNDLKILLRTVRVILTGSGAL
ncbi:MAG: sugar transferase [Planctomycetaceae bacterium]